VILTFVIGFVKSKMASPKPSWPPRAGVEAGGDLL